MPIKNFWSLEAGEAMVAEELQKRLRGWEIFFPVKDVGVDIVAVSGIGSSVRRVLTFQVKESKAFENKEKSIKPVNTVTNWFSPDSSKARRFLSRVDFYLFVCSRYDFRQPKKTLTADYVIVPSNELVRRLTSYRSSPEKKWYLYLCVEQSGRCLDWRGISRKNVKAETTRPERDYGAFVNNWQSVISVR